MTVVWLAGLREAAAVAQLLGEFRDHMGRDEPDDAHLLESVKQLIESGETEFWLGAAEADEAPAGVCHLRFRYSLWVGAEECWVEDLFVREVARRHGLASALVQRALERACERGCKRIELDTNEDNHAALRLYQRLGFSATSKGPSRSLLLGGRLDC